MQRDMHYFGTYAMARAAGIGPKACQVIATAAEFVDDNGDKETIRFPDGGRLDFVPTAHHAADIKNIDHHDQRLIWVPFHFLPGNEGETISERLQCRKDSAIVRELVDHNLTLAHKPFGLHLAGITAHVHADTFSHYGFSGVSSRWNRVDSRSFELYDLDPEIRTYITGKARGFRIRFRREMGNLLNYRAVRELKDRFVSDTAEALSGALGHGAVMTYPDRPYLRWEFTYEEPRHASGIRDNPATFLEGCARLHEMFIRLAELRPDIRVDEGRRFADIRHAVEAILAKQKDKKGRENAWRQAARRGELFVAADKILPYRGAQWAGQLDSLRKARSSAGAVDRAIFKFFQAAATHRTFVLRDLLPRHGLAVD